MRKICTSPSGGSPRLKYDYDGSRCDAIIEWFKGREHPVNEVEDKSGRVTPVADVPPTFEGYAAETGIPTYILLRWKKEHRGFREACLVCEDIMQAAVMEIGARVPGCSKFISDFLKNKCGWNTSDAGSKEFAPIRIFEVGQKVEAPVEEIEAGEEAVAIEATETTDVKPMEVKTDEN